MKKAKKYIIGGVVLAVILFLLFYRPKMASQEELKSYQESINNELKAQGDSASEPQKTLPYTTTKWMCGFCDTLFSQGNILDAFAARICPGCGDIRMTKGESWLWESEFELLPDAGKKQLDIEAFLGDSGVYEYPEMPLEGAREEMFASLSVDAESILDQDYTIVTYHSTEVYEYDGYELDTYLEYSGDKLRSVHFFWTSNRIQAEKSFENLAEIMIAKYGEPDEEIDTTFNAETLHQKYDSRIMKWRANKNGIESILQLTCFDGELSISYANAQ